jgi:hypothetical protein
VAQCRFVDITILTVHIASMFKACSEDGDSILHLQKLYGVTAHNITFWRCFFFSSIATRCFCLHYEIFRRNIHTSYADTHWHLIRLRYSHTHVSYYEEVTVSADLYGCEIWTAEEIDKKINWVHEIRFVKYCYGERILDAAKKLEKT